MTGAVPYDSNHQQLQRNQVDEKVRQAAARNPLSHPLATSIRCFDFELPPPEHIREIYGAVYRAMSEQYPEAPDRLCRLMPREHGKTEAGTIVVPTWASLSNPNVRILLMSINESKAADKLSEVSEHIEDLAPKFGHSVVKSNETQLQLERSDTYEEPTIQAAGFKTGVTGGHYDLLVFDDIVTYETQRTQHRREHSWSKFQDFLNLDSKAGNSVFLVLGTQKHRNDLYSQLLQGPKWDSRVEKAIKDWSIIENGEYSVKTRHQETGEESWYPAEDFGDINPKVETIVNIEVHRDNPDVLWPEWASAADLIDDMITGYGAEQGTLIWQRENQNDPSALEGEILSADMLDFESELPNESLRFYAGVDLGVEDDPEKAARNDTDFWAFCAIAEAVKSNLVYVVRLSRKRGMGQKEGVEWIGRQMSKVQQRHQDEIAQVLIESNQAQRWVTEHGKDEGLPFEESNSSGEKEQRIIDMSSLFERGRVIMLEGAMSNWEKFISDEWCGFPTAAHDDRLDSMEIALRNLDRDDDEGESWLVSV